MHLSVRQVDCKNHLSECPIHLSEIYKANATYVKILNTQSSVGQVLQVFHLSDCHFYSSQTFRRAKFRTLQERRNSSVLAMELCLSCSNPSTYGFYNQRTININIVFVSAKTILGIASLTIRISMNFSLKGRKTHLEKGKYRNYRNQKISLIWNWWFDAKKYLTPVWRFA